MKIKQPLTITLAVIWLWEMNWFNQVGTSNEPGQVINSEKLKEVVREFIHTHLPQDIILEFHRLPEAIRVPEGKLELQVLPGNHGDLKGNVVINLEVFVNNELQEKIPLCVKIRTFEKVVVARNRINRHQIIRAEDIGLEKRETTLISQKLLTLPQEVVGKRAKGIINPGRILEPALIEPVPLIQRGDLVTIMVKLGNVSVSTVGKALEDGYQDQWITVENVSSRKRLTAQVQDSKTVLVCP
ncbi:MAG: flagellar basal body P-ring formation chaperone FlgA [candidate division KSB1 bacterium]|nr:flagellar basal body P-ring formation chaperone FlgA [candidate division KSB1 bacterium]